MKLPRWVNVTHYQRGDVLWHGTSMRYGITDLEGPAWVSNSHAVASWFSRWKDDGDGVPRVMRYEVVQPFTLPTFDPRVLQQLPDGGAGRIEWSVWLAHLLGDDLDFVHDIQGRADEICAAGYAGWRIVNNYASGDDIMICRPERYLRRVQAGWNRRPR